MDEFEKAINLRNLYQSLKKCCAGSMWKDGTALYRWDGLENSVKLRAAFKAGTYKLQKYQHFRITRPKPRDITATRIRDRHAQRSSCDNVLYPAITQSFIHDNGACQRGKGVDFAINRTKCNLQRLYRRQRRARAETAGCRIEEVGPFQAEAWVYKGDVSKYFPSSSFAVAKETIRKVLRSEKLISVFCATVESFGETWWARRAMEAGATENAAGKFTRMVTDARTEREYIPIRPEAMRAEISVRCEAQIRRAVAQLADPTPVERDALLEDALRGDARGIGLGCQMSQLVQLAQLSAIDHYAKEVMRCEIYMRYMDDYVIIDPDRDKVKRTAKGIEDMLRALGLAVNPKSQHLRLRDGFAFLRWHFYLMPTGKVIMKAAQGVAENERRRLRRMMEKARAGKATVESIRTHYEGWRAHIARGNTHNLLRRMDKYFKSLLDAAGGKEDHEHQG